MSEGTTRPNFDIECQNCGQLPTVTIITQDEDDENSESELCGPCFFGGAACIDHENW